MPYIAQAELQAELCKVQGTRGTGIMLLFFQEAASDLDRYFRGIMWVA